MQVYRVGGYVRDQLLGRQADDCDYVVVGASSAQMLALGYRQVGAAFPVFLHPKTGEEYALARSEKKSGRGHRDFLVTSNPTISLEEDLQRRDLTINAIAQAADGELIDPYGGVADLHAGVLRHISSAFRDDPLRILRVARFAAQLNFAVAPETLSLLSEMAEQQDGLSISRERIVQESSKALLSQNPARFFQILHTTHNLPIFFPRMAAVLSTKLVDFCQDLTTTSSNEERLGILALYTQTATPDDTRDDESDEALKLKQAILREIVLNKKELHRLNKWQQLSRLCKSSKANPQQVLASLRRLNIFRDYAEFSRIAGLYQGYLQRKQQPGELEYLQQIERIASAVLNSSIQHLTTGQFTPQQLAQAIDQHYLTIIQQMRNDNVSPQLSGTH